MKVMFAPHNTYHARTFLAVVPHLNGDVCFLNCDRYHGEGIADALRGSNVRELEFSLSAIRSELPDVLVVMNDWGGPPALAIREAKRLGIPTVSHVEGAQDYLDTHMTTADRKRHPYSWADYCFAIGDFDLTYTQAERSIVTGSPRFDELMQTYNNKRYPERPSLAINLNFSYGVHADVAEAWITQIMDTADALGMNYRISQHRADLTKVPKDKVYNGSIYDLINESTLLVSRFSTCMLEALLMDTPIVYFNPHNEKQVTFQDAMGGFPVATDVTQLSQSLQDITANPGAYLKQATPFLNHHVAALDGSASKQFANALEKVAGRQSASRSRLAYLRNQWAMFKLNRRSQT